MGDSQGNPFISNPFMQGASKKQRPEPSPEPQRKSEPLAEGQRLKEPQPSKGSSATPLSKKSAPPAAKKPVSSAPKKSAPSVTKKPAAKTRSRAKKKETSPPPSPTVSAGYSGNGYKVQVLAKIPMPGNTNMPSRDYLWFAVYPIIPRVGDCIFHDGRYFRVDAVFLYENTNAGWCADLEVSYYTRRH